MHTCFKSLLGHTFGLSAVEGAATVAPFLVPRLRLAPRASRIHRRHGLSRSFYSRRRSSLEGYASPNHALPKPDANLLLPPRHARHTPASWIRALEPALPPHLRDVHYESASPENAERESTTVQHLSLLLVQARGWNSTDVLATLGVDCGRWDAVHWIVQAIVEHPPLQEGAWNWVARPSSRVSSSSLDEISTAPIEESLLSFPPLSSTTLESITDSLPDLPNLGVDLRKGAIGQIWRTLGNLILLAATSGEEKAGEIMLHVLQIIAQRHHAGVIPETIYRYSTPQDHHTLHQPPTLHLLSSRILSALSDAAWLSREGSAAVEQKIVKNHYTILGHQIPGSQHKLRVPELGPEVWLELVLWSCLHGGWIAEGAAILRRICRLSGNEAFTLICWTDIVRSMEAEMPRTASIDWNAIKSTMDALVRKRRARPGERQLVERTVSTEVVAAFVEALVNTIRVGTGYRGIPPQLVIDHLKALKELLDRNSMGLGALTWDALLVRFADSGGVNTETDPGSMEKALRLVQPFGRELQSVNLPPKGSGSAESSSYIFEPTAAPLGLLHRTLRAEIKHGNIKGAMQTFQSLQSYTDTNKRMSIESFFRHLGASTSKGPGSSDLDFGSNIPPGEFPAYFPQMSIPLLADLLDLATQSKSFEFGRWLLSSNDVDGPLISRQMYKNQRLAVSIIRFGTATHDKHLLREVLSAKSARPGTDGPMLQPAVVSAFLECQIEFRNWDSVENLLTHLGSDSLLSWTIKAAVILAKTLMQFEIGGIAVDDAKKARDIFTALVSNAQGRALKVSRAKLDGVLGVLTSINAAWAWLCVPLFEELGVKRLRMDIDDFNNLLEAVTETYGSVEGRRLCEKWCSRVLTGKHWIEPPPGGVSNIPNPRPVPLHQEDVANDIVLDTGGEAPPLSFRGRLTPNVGTFRVILDRLKKEILRTAPKSNASDAERQECVQWAAVNLHRLGLSKEAVLEEISELELPASPNGTSRG